MNVSIPLACKGTHPKFRCTLSAQVATCLVLRYTSTRLAMSEKVISRREFKPYLRIGNFYLNSYRAVVIVYDSDLACHWLIIGPWE
jgi:hypothetical protein